MENTSSGDEGGSPIPSPGPTKSYATPTNRVSLSINILVDFVWAGVITYILRLHPPMYNALLQLQEFVLLKCQLSLVRSLLPLLMSPLLGMRAPLPPRLLVAVCQCLLANWPPLVEWHLPGSLVPVAGRVVGTPLVPRVSIQIAWWPPTI